MCILKGLWFHIKCQALKYILFQKLLHSIYFTAHHIWQCGFKWTWTEFELNFFSNFICAFLIFIMLHYKVFICIFGVGGNVSLFRIKSSVSFKLRTGQMTFKFWLKILNNPLKHYIISKIGQESNFQQILYSCPFENCSCSFIEWHNTYQGTSDLLNYFRKFLKITHCYLFYMEKQLFKSR